MTSPSEPPASAPGLQGADYLRLIAIGAAIGIPAALVAAGFLALVDVAETWLWTDLPHGLGQSTPPWYLVVFLPAVGAVLVWLARRFLPGDGGHKPLLGIGGGATPWRYGPSIALAAFATLAFGAVLGPEAPLIALGSVTGMVLVSMAKVTDERAQTVLATAGSFSAVSAVFGGPLVAGFLLLEAGLAQGVLLIPALLPGLVAAAVGYVLFVGLGTWGGLNRASLSIPHLPLYQGTHIVDMLLAIVVGVVVAVIVLAVRRLAFTITPFAARRMLVILLAGGLAVGVIAEVARLLGADSQLVLFSGQAGVPELVATGSAATVLVLLAGKALGYGICMGCGFRGGPVFPSIFIGVAVAMFAVIGLGLSPTWAVAVGAGAGMTAGTRLVFASLLFSFLLVGTNGLDTVPAAVLAVVASWLTSTVLRQRFPEPTDVQPAPTA